MCETDGVPGRRRLHPRRLVRGAVAAGVLVAVGAVVALAVVDSHPVAPLGPGGGPAAGVPGGWSVGYVVGWSIAGVGAAFAVGVALLARRWWHRRREQQVRQLRRSPIAPPAPLTTTALHLVPGCDMDTDLDEDAAVRRPRSPGRSWPATHGPRS